MNQSTMRLISGICFLLFSISRNSGEKRENNKAERLCLYRKTLDYIILNVRSWTHLTLLQLCGIIFFRLYSPAFVCLFLYPYNMRSTSQYRKSSPAVDRLFSFKKIYKRAKAQVLVKLLVSCKSISNERWWTPGAAWLWYIRKTGYPAFLASLIFILATRHMSDKSSKRFSFLFSLSVVGNRQSNITAAARHTHSREGLKTIDGPQGLLYRRSGVVVMLK